MIHCPNDHTVMLPATLRQLRLVVQLQADAGFFSASGSDLKVYTCPRCGLTHLYAEPPLGQATDMSVTATRTA
ncbi:hypothetical protein [Deinococcus aquiradiocola]|uniref:Uncharacterized protein n=1 Tax=Deinococcus aquiradiocola TaxID=393059 RepID=A0A917UMP4_9DEIO|nr:hypothetical protein [Deinococcus aquiradiocola]GGJ68451.1 hypothetical protein GCM10008939_11090 [Deinococcus aquiradiocola]